MTKRYIKLLVRFGLILAAVLLVSRVSRNDTSALAGEYAGIISSDTPIGGFVEAVRAVNSQKADPVPANTYLPGGVSELAMNTDGCDSNGETFIADNDVPAGSIVPGDTSVPADNAATVPGATDRATDIPAEDGTNIPGDDAADIPAEDVPVSGDVSDDPDGAADDGSDPGADGTDDNGSGTEKTDVADSSGAADIPDGEDNAGNPVSGQASSDPAQGDGDTDGADSSISEYELAIARAANDESYKKTQEYIDALLVTSPEHYNAGIVAEALSLPLESNDARYEFLTGKGYKAYTIYDLPDGFTSDTEAAKRMETFDVPVWKMTKEGKKYSSTWPITINSKLAASVKCIFSDIYLLDIKFPFNYLKGYMFRKVGGSGLVNSKLLSIHSFGAAMDINFWDNDNDYYLGKGNDLRDKDNPYCIPDQVIEIFADYGWNWGGNFDICVDSMHFQYFGLEFLQYTSSEPFPILSIDGAKMDKIYVRNLTQRLRRLGYLRGEGDKFTEDVDAAVKAFQEDYGLEPDGIVDYETWVPLINATHDMSYVF